jgi:heme exporter protein B
MLATLPAGALLGLDGTQLSMVELGLLAGTPGLAALGVMVAAITAGLKGGAALAGLLVIPLAVPILIFGAGALASGGASGVALCGRSVWCWWLWRPLPGPGRSGLEGKKEDVRAIALAP